MTDAKRYFKVREKKYVRVNRNNFLIGLSSSLFLTGLIVYFLIIPQISNVQNVAKIDPNVVQNLKNGVTTTMYISGYELKISGCEKEWHFGNITICKYKTNSYTEFQNIISKADKKILSVVGSYTAKKYPIYFLQIDKDYSKFREEDIDNKVVLMSDRYCGKGVTVAIIDTGIDYLHPDFYDNNVTIIDALVSCIYKDNKSCIVVNTSGYTYEQMKSLYLWEQANKQNDEYIFEDTVGHGTHCAGIIAGRGVASHGKYKGIAPCTRLVIIKAFRNDGTATMDDILDSLQWCYDNCKKYNVSVLSLSWGAPMPSVGYDPISIAVDKIHEDKGIWIAVAGGNMGNYPGTITVPAVAHDVITVSAWDSYKNKFAWFSSMGPTKDLRMKPDLSAPGVFIVAPKSQMVDFPDEYETEDGYYVALSGTSMATPVVAGTMANFIQYYRAMHGKNPKLSDFIEFEKVNAIKISPMKDFITGYGIVQSP